MSYTFGLRSGGPLKIASFLCSALLLSACGSTTDPSASSSSSSSSSGSSTSGSSSSSSTSSGNVQPQDHCIDGFAPHFTNGLISDGGYAHTQNNEVDLSVDPAVYNYMYDNGWQDAHVLWHQARTCGGFGSFPINGLPSACDFTDNLPAQNDCQGDINGVDFFSGHRIMMYQLRELWPDHSEQFTGWDTFPKTAQDYPPELRPYFKGWSAEILEAADIGDNIANHLDMFPTEGALGTWMSCAIMPNIPGGGFQDFSTQRNLHFALHANGVPSRNQKHAVNNNNNNIDAYLFWKLHGWVDTVWENYRIAKGKTQNDADYKAEMLEQCREMDRWREISVDARGSAGHPNQDENYVAPIVETGFFNDVVAPALEEAGCTTCHGLGETAGLRLGFDISSTEVVERLINRDSSYAQGYKLVVPGQPDQSWLYLKASGQSLNSGVTCQGVGNCYQQMPGLTQQGLQDLRQWILDGAQAPIILN